VKRPTDCYDAIGGRPSRPRPERPARPRCHSRVACFRCGRRIGPDGWLTIAKAEPRANGGLRYPDRFEPVAAFFQCRACALASDDRDSGYDIELSRIRAADGAGGTDSLQGWMTHLSRKQWWSPDLADALEMAHQLARGAR